MLIRSGLSLEGYFIKGTYKNYVMLRGGRGSTNLSYIVMYIERDEGVFCEIFYVMPDTQFESSKSLT